MTPKEAVAAARAFFADNFSEPATLEEIWFEDTSNVWCVTFGIRRRTVKTSGDLLGFNQAVKEAVDYKVVRIRDKDGSFVSILNREGQRAA